MFYITNYLTVTGANPGAVLESIENEAGISSGQREENSLWFNTEWFPDSIVATLSSKFPDHELRLWSIPSNCSEGMGMTAIFFNGELVEWFTDMDEIDNIVTHDFGLTPGDCDGDCSENVIGYTSARQSGRKQEQ